MLAVQFVHLKTAIPSALPLQWLTIASSCWTVSVSTACCLCSKVLLSVELPSSPWSWLTSWLCLSTSSWSCCFSRSNPCSSLPYRASSAKSLCSRKLPKTGSKKSLWVYSVDLMFLQTSFTLRWMKVESDGTISYQVWRCILNGMGWPGGKTIHSGFTFHSGGCTNLLIYMRMANWHQGFSLIGLTWYKHLYCNSIHRWACMLASQS